MRQWRILHRRTSQPKQASLLAPIEVAEQSPAIRQRLRHVSDVANSFYQQLEYRGRTDGGQYGYACNPVQLPTYFCMQRTSACGFHLQTGRGCFLNAMRSENALTDGWALPRPSRGFSPLHSREGLRPVHPFSRSFLISFAFIFRVLRSGEHAFVLFS